jgi:hypothetical protein
MSANFRCADALFTDWPEVDFLVGNPPFLGGNKIRHELGDERIVFLFKLYEGRVPPTADMCCYWFEKARQQIAAGKCQRAGLLATQAIRGGANREVLKRIKESGDIFFAVSDREWILDGANVHVSMVGFDNGEETQRTLDGHPVTSINPNLTSRADVTGARPLNANLGICFMGPSPKAVFDISEAIAREMLVASGNTNARPNSDVLRRVQSGVDLTSADRGTWTIDFAVRSIEDAARYEAPFEYLQANVYAVRSQNRRKSYAERWWQYAEARPGMRKALAGIRRFVATPEVAKHRVFVWRMAEHLCNQQTLVFARKDDYFFGVLQSRAHEIWALKLGTRLETRPRYTPTTCFETFPFPFPDDLQPPRPEPVRPPPKAKKPPEPDRFYAENLAAKNYFMGKEDPPPYGNPSALRTPDSALDYRTAIAAAAKHLNEERERWLNPPEWTETRTLEFPGSSSGPWARYVDPETVDAETGVGAVRYPRLEPRDADCAAKLKKRTLTNLYNERPAWLDLAHKKLDAAVAAAYGWPPDLSDEQLLERLLALNLERAEEEAKAGKVG